MDGARAVFEGRASFGENRGSASAHYKRFAKAGYPGYSLEEAERPAEDALDGDLDYLMAWHTDIRNRALRGMHFEPISHQEIMAYEHFLAKLNIEMTAFDWDMLCRLDNVWQDCVPKESEKPKPNQTRH